MSLAGKRIFIVDDNPDNLQVLAEILSIWDAQVRTFLSPMEALQVMQIGERVDLVLTDFQMPEMNGVQLLQRMRQMEQLARIPTICVTAYGREVETQFTNGITHRFDGILAKPVGIDALLNIVQYALNQTG